MKDCRGDARLALCFSNIELRIPCPMIHIRSTFRVRHGSVQDNHCIYVMTFFQETLLRCFQQLFAFDLFGVVHLCLLKLVIALPYTFSLLRLIIRDLKQFQILQLYLHVSINYLFSQNRCQKYN